MKWLSGKKTYFVVAAAIASALAGLATGELTVGEFAVAVLNALGLGALRAGVKKVEKAAK